jgi:hypothetical protein
MSRQIFGEQFGFLEGIQIHKAVGVAREGLHSIKVKNLNALVVKVDLLKTYDRVSWLCLRSILIHLGYSSRHVS